MASSRTSKPSAVKTTPRKPARKAPAAKVVPARGSGAKLKVVDTPPLFDLETALADMPDNFIQCRDWMHAWAPYTAEYDAVARLYISTLRCRRCTALKVRSLNRNGAIVASHYDYPEGYQIAGSGRLDGDARNMIRMRSVLRQINVDPLAAEDAGA